ncbi:TlpA disulfide reductase family protein [Winogradskyella sp.]|uniref:TlpA disulfide reductase family protein n=1 Tax=Winogradskyella sp. TaxID=1883156 RepID=UPI0025FC4833|nr:TlpA disulfide reductase family protein [Winogradskyella sp.]
MKRILTIAIIGLLLVGCKEDNRTDYVINGKAEGVYNGVRVYLKTLDFKTARERIIDTAIVMNEKFSFQGALEYPELRFLTVNSVAGRLSILIENNDIDININKDNISTSSITGSAIHKAFQDYEAEFFEFQKEVKAIIPEYRKSQNSTNKQYKDSLTDVLQKSKEELTLFPINYIKRNNTDYLSLIILEQEVDKGTNNIKICKETFENLDKKLKNYPMGNKLGLKINDLNQIYLRTAHLEVGNLAPDFKAPTPNGKIVSLNELKGKVTIIDFWAAWCGPCRRENPNVVRVYEKYHDKGLEIIGVSLDGQSRQQNPKKAWLDAIEKDKLTWNHVSNLKYFNDPIAKLYNITAIPATYILDSEGKIVATNLRGKALELKVKELLSK